MRSRMHNPDGGSFKKHQQEHKLKKEKKAKSAEERILRKKKVTLKDLRDLIDETLNQ